MEAHVYSGVAFKLSLIRRVIHAIRGYGHDNKYYMKTFPLMFNRDE